MSTNTSPANTGNGPGLKKDALGTWGIVFLVISATAPLSVLAGVAPLAILIGGISAPLAYLIAGVVLAIFAIGFMYMTKHVSALGGFYTYITKALGRVVGLGSGILAWVSYNALQIGLYGLMGVLGQGMFSAVFNIDVPWWVIAFAGIVLVFLLAYFGVDVGAKVLGVLLILETLVLLWLSISILVQIGPDSITWGAFSGENLFNPGMFAILGFGFAAFMGFESTALYREETANPNRAIPRATYISVAFLAIFYSFTAWAVIQGFGEAHVQEEAAKDPAALFFTAMGQYVGPFGVTLMFILILTSIYAGQLAFHNAINRYSFSLSRDEIFPGFMGRTHKKFGSPWIAGTVQTVMAAVVVAVFVIGSLDPYLQLLIWVNTPGVYGVILLQVLTTVAVIAFLIRNHKLPRRWYIWPSTILAFLTMLGLLIVMVATVDVLTAGGPVLNTVLLLIVPVVWLIGAIWALVLKRRNPRAFARIGGES